MIAQTERISVIILTSVWCLTIISGSFLSANAQQPASNRLGKIEVYPNEGSQTLAVVLQYEGVVDLAGVTGALKLPAGFKATLPLTSDKNRFDISLSSWTMKKQSSKIITLTNPRIRPAITVTKEDAYF
jgi:hypothetical protein